MKKKFLALVLTLAMVLSLVPVTALATDGSAPTDNDTESVTASQDGVNITKKVVPDGDNYNLVMEAYVEGTTTETTTSTPLDIVLVLDVSGSMDDSMGKKDSQKRIDALKSAVNAFIDNVAQKNKDTKGNTVGHRISIVKFAGEKATEVGNDTYRESGNKYNYSQIVKELTAVDANGKKALTDAVNGLRPAGATQADYGMQLAQSVLSSSNEDSNRDKVVVMFTDGTPTSWRYFESGVASAAISASKALKDTGVKVYTVGIFKDANSSEIRGDWNNEYGKNKNNKYMQAVSSNYPTASLVQDWWGQWQWNPGQRAEGNYYLTATDADGLKKVFQEISNSITTTQVTANASAVLRDTLTKQFVLNGNENDITVQKAKVTGKIGNTYSWETPKNVDTVEKAIDGKTVTVKGFNYSEDNVITEKNRVYSGYKLIVTIPIKVDDTYTGWLAGKHYYNTNDIERNKAGLTGYTKDGQEASTLLDTSPNVPVTAYKVTYEWGDIKNATSVTDNQYYINGQTAQVKDTVQKETAVQGNNGQWYRFRGWSLDGVKVIESVAITNSDVTLKPVLTEAYTVTYTDGVEDEVVFTDDVHSNLINGDPTPGFIGTPTRDGYKFTGWKPTVAEKVTGNAVYTAQWEKEEVLYTLIFDPNGGAWSDTTFNGYTVSDGKASRSGVPGTEQITSTSITAPTNQGKVLDGWGYYDNGKLIKISNLDYPADYAPTVEQLYNEYGQKPTNTVILYAIWKDDTTSADSLTYTINQHYIRSETDATDADNIQIAGLSSERGTEISALIAKEAQNQDWRGNHYFYDSEKTTVNQTKLADNATLERKGTVIDLYYYLDNWKDADTTSGEDTDSETGGDDIPDCQQVKIQYLAYKENGGTVSRQVEIATFDDNDELNTVVYGSTARANSGFTFVTWSGRDVAVNDITVNSVIAATEPKSEAECKPSSTELVKGNAYTYTAIFLEDKIGGGDNKDQPDGIPDRYQVTINYVSSDTSKGSVGTLTKEVLTIYENGKEGKWASKGKVVASGSTATATGSSRNYFSNWTNDAGLATSYTAALGQQTFTAEGGKTYTFTANFGRSSGGSNRPKPPVVEIPDDVPTGLNGKDHYAYVVGYPDGMVYPQKNITRAEVATIFFRLLEDETREANMTKSNSYNDMKDGAWYTCAVSTLSKMGIIKGYEDGSFKPDASISRAEFAAIAARFDPDGDKTPATFSDVSSHWAKDEISIAANHGWIKGYEDGSFKPDQKITRAETMTLVNRVLKRLPETKDDLHKDMKTWPDNQNESAWFYLAVQEATNSHYQKLKKDGIHEMWESMRETRDWAALEK